MQAIKPKQVEPNLSPSNHLPSIHRESKLSGANTTKNTAFGMKKLSVQVERNKQPLQEKSSLQPNHQKSMIETLKFNSTIHRGSRLSNQMIRNDTETGTLKYSSPSKSPVPADHVEEKVSEILDDDDDKEMKNEQAGKTQNTPFQDKKKLESFRSKNKKEVNKKMTETIKIYDD